MTWLSGVKPVSSFPSSIPSQDSKFKISFNKKLHHFLDLNLRRDIAAWKFFLNQRHHKAFSTSRSCICQDADDKLFQNLLQHSFTSRESISARKISRLSSCLATHRLTLHSHCRWVVKSLCASQSYVDFTWESFDGVEIHVHEQLVASYAWSLEHWSKHVYCLWFPFARCHSRLQDIIEQPRPKSKACENEGVLANKRDTKFIYLSAVVSKKFVATQHSLKTTQTQSCCPYKSENNIASLTELNVLWHQQYRWLRERKATGVTRKCEK